MLRAYARAYVDGYADRLATEALVVSLEARVRAALDGVPVDDLRAIRDEARATVELDYPELDGLHRRAVAAERILLRVGQWARRGGRNA